MTPSGKRPPAKTFGLRARATPPRSVWGASTVAAPVAAAPVRKRRRETGRPCTAGTLWACRPPDVKELRSARQRSSTMPVWPRWSVQLRPGALVVDFRRIVSSFSNRARKREREASQTT